MTHDTMLLLVQDCEVLLPIVMEKSKAGENAKTEVTDSEETETEGEPESVPEPEGEPESVPEPEPESMSKACMLPPKKCYLSKKSPKVTGDSNMVSEQQKFMVGESVQVGCGNDNRMCSARIVALNEGKNSVIVMWTNPTNGKATSKVPLSQIARPPT